MCLRTRPRPCIFSIHARLPAPAPPAADVRQVVGLGVSLHEADETLPLLRRGARAVGARREPGGPRRRQSCPQARRRRLAPHTPCDCCTCTLLSTRIATTRAGRPRSNSTSRSRVCSSPSSSRSHSPVRSPLSQTSSRLRTVALSNRKVAVPVEPSRERVSATSGTAASGASSLRNASVGTTEQAASGEASCRKRSVGWRQRALLGSCKAKRDGRRARTARSL